MQFRRTLPGRSSTDFLFTEPESGGLSTDRQLFIADLVMEYRRKYPMLMINVVWDFGIEEGDPVKGEKYGVFEQCRDNAVYNAQMLTISLNHARVGKMPREADPEQIRGIEEYYESYADLQAVFAEKRRELLSKGVPWPQVEDLIRKEMGIVPCEDTESIQRIMIHEIGHMLSEESGAVHKKEIKKLFAKCRDGFENLYEFCAECFMASELTDRIGLANEYRRILLGVI